VTVAVRRAALADEAVAWAIVDEYNRTFGVVVRDEPADFRKYLDGAGALWLACDGTDIAGCVAMRPLPAMGSRACEVKRLYVRPAYRGSQIAAALMDALEAHARDAGYDMIYLDTRADFTAAIRFYDARGYERIPRYNDNPEAAVFMRRPPP
jgi:ribosomal protein S18 acetylase RimI-like enzyme